MKILITGKSGQVGFELQRSMAVLGEVVSAGREECDLAIPGSVRALVQAERPDIIVNAAAYTAVDKAEQESELAFRINGEGPGVLAAEAATIGALLIHYSTDYVFDGSKKGFYREDDSAAPQGVYGRTKLAGEQAVRALLGEHIILRTSWVFGTYGANFLKTVLRLIRERDSVAIVADQFGAPTSAALIADVTAHIVARYASRHANRGDFPYGTYHLAAAGETSWHQYACLVAKLAREAGLPLKVQPEQIRAIATSDYPLPAARPANSRLDTERLRAAFGLTLPTWQIGVQQAMQLIAGQGKN
ncbi:dTDP-4-dehydrorhamnose reductase [Bordetella petrii]|nr:dTDP-4-dehydrorhamnose reductase [Bordetella petrii]